MSTVPLTSIIIPVRNQSAFTRMCLTSLNRHTPQPHEVIVVDNRSTDDTPALLRSTPGIRVITNSFNRGFASAVNQGMEAARGEYLVLLNNDTLPSHRWLIQLLTVLQSDPRNGMVGPVSNRVIPEQKVPVRLFSPERIHAFCQSFNRSTPRKWRTVRRLSGFCLALPSRLVKEVGYLDERFGVGTYEDDDYSYRVRRAGYRCMVAGDTYVHHFGHRSFQTNGYREYRKILRQNRRYFLYKWGFFPK